ncbi:hypothetical protein L1987_50441 [Smallanthus sonchifolius]|uniref:Uncharacterized protein n=1 Tax=Smallanthus sonchifolius TaxID=185202 RepID=A0ACB9EMI2_9ASTR|nr:hypothetical protein L1987_50441 [Smallanthus sonchifolius]
MAVTRLSYSGKQALIHMYGPAAIIPLSASFTCSGAVVCIHIHTNIYPCNEVVLRLYIALFLRILAQGKEAALNSGLDDEEELVDIMEFIGIYDINMVPPSSDLFL